MDSQYSYLTTGVVCLCQPGMSGIISNWAASGYLHMHSNDWAVSMCRSSAAMQLLVITTRACARGQASSNILYSVHCSLWNRLSALNCSSPGECRVDSWCINILQNSDFSVKLSVKSVTDMQTEWQTDTVCWAIVNRLSVAVLRSCADKIRLVWQNLDQTIILWLTKQLARAEVWTVDNTLAPHVCHVVLRSGCYNSAE